MKNKIEQKCNRCGEDSYQCWTIPGVNEKKHLCKKCLSLLIELMLRYMNDKEWEFKMLKYEERLERKEV
jgi:hypothetical protein